MKERINQSLLQFAQSVQSYRTIVLKESTSQLADRINVKFDSNFTSFDLESLELGKPAPLDLVFMVLDVMQVLTSAVSGMQNQGALYIASTQLPENIEEHVLRQMQNQKD